jgi:hypothetical protein
VSISGIGANPVPTPPVQSKPPAPPKPALAPDGDTPAVEAAETAATKLAELKGGGSAKGVNIVA